MIRKIFFNFLKISILWPFTFYSDPALAYCGVISVTFLSGESLSDEEKDMEEDEKEDGKDVDEQDDDGFFIGHGVLDKNRL